MFYAPRMSRSAANLLLLVTAAIWGSAFVAQSLAMRVMDPVWYSGLRFLLAAAVLAPFAYAEWRRRTEPFPRDLWPVVAVVCVVMCAASLLQQVAMQTATATNAGFLTSLYVLFTPIAGYLIYRDRARAVVWVGAALGLAGTYLLGGGFQGFTAGDGMIVVTAVGWAILLVLIGRIVQRAGRPVLLAFVQTLFTGVVCTSIAIPLMPISAGAVVDAFWPLLYGGILSGGMAYTFQAIAQRHTRATDAAIVFAAEAPFAALAGALVLGERLTAMGGVGCALIFCAILLVQLWPERRPVGAAGAA